MSALATVTEMARLDPSLSPRRYAAWQRACDLLADGAWHPYSHVYEAMRRDPEPMSPRSTQNLIAQAARDGCLDQTGGRPVGTRQLRRAADR